MPDGSAWRRRSPRWSLPTRRMESGPSLRCGGKAANGALRCCRGWMVSDAGSTRPVTPWRSRGRSGGSSRPRFKRSAADRSRPSPDCCRKPRSGSTTSSRPSPSRPQPGSPRSTMAHLDRGERAALLERFRRYLRDHRLPVTRQRALVAQTVLLAEDHLSVDGIRRRLREKGEQVGTATVYRTLDVLLESGLVRAHDFGEGFKRYEPMPAQAHHEHLICERCGRVVEFQNERLERMLP